MGGQRGVGMKPGVAGCLRLVRGRQGSCQSSWKGTWLRARLFFVSWVLVVQVWRHRRRYPPKGSLQIQACLCPHILHGKARTKQTPQTRLYCTGTTTSSPKRLSHSLLRADDDLHPIQQFVRTLLQMPEKTSHLSEGRYRQTLDGSCRARGHKQAGC